MIDLNKYIYRYNFVPETSAGGVVCKIESGAVYFLTIKRNQMNDWTLPKGHRDGGESLQETAIREVEEETSIKAYPEKYIDMTKYYVVDEKERVIYIRSVFWFLMRPENTDISKKSDKEIAEVKWLKYDDLLSLLTYESDKDILKKVRGLLEL